MAEKFNEFCVNIGNIEEEKIPNSKSHFSDFHKNSESNSIFLSPLDDKEVTDMFSKSCGPNSIPSNSLKLHADICIGPVNDMIKISSSEGVFSNIIKIAHVCTVVKKR